MRKDIAVVLAILLAACQPNQSTDNNIKIKASVKRASSSIVVVLTNKGESIGLGGGVVLTRDGYILTCKHIVDDAEVQTVILFDDRKSYVAHRVAMYQKDDLAVIKILQPPKGLVPVVIGDPGRMEITDEVILISHPRSLMWSVSLGRINAFRANRAIIQTDVVGTKGSSGGGLFDLDGRLLGLFKFKVVENPLLPPDSDLNMFASVLQATQGQPSVWDIIKTHRHMPKQPTARPASPPAL